MPSREYHLKRDREAFGEEFDEVHRILDQFSHYPDQSFLKDHRKFLHHEEGVAYITKLLGETAGKAAKLHIRDDTGGNLPKAEDYYNGNCNNWGEVNTWFGVNKAVIDIVKEREED